MAGSYKDFRFFYAKKGGLEHNGNSLGKYDDEPLAGGLFECAFASCGVGASVNPTSKITVEEPQ